MTVTSRTITAAAGPRAPQHQRLGSPATFSLDGALTGWRLLLAAARRAPVRDAQRFADRVREDLERVFPARRKDGR